MDTFDNMLLYNAIILFPLLDNWKLKMNKNRSLHGPYLSGYFSVSLFQSFTFHYAWKVCFEVTK